MINRRKFIPGIISCIILIGLFYLSSVSPTAESNNGLETSKTIDAFEYAITPQKTPEKWKEFQSHDEMIDACQIPDTILLQLTTTGLVKACFQYPLFGDILYYNSPYYGFSQVENHFYGLRELFRRDDAGSILLSVYRDINLTDLKLHDKFAISRMKWIDIIMSDQRILDKLSYEQRTELISCIYNNIQIINEKYFDFYYVTPEIVSIGRMLDMDSNEFKALSKNDKRIQEFLSTGQCPNVSETERNDLLNIMTSIIKDRLSK